MKPLNDLIWTDESLDDQTVKINGGPEMDEICEVGMDPGDCIPVPIV